MKHWILAISLFCLADKAMATPYFRTSITSLPVVTGGQFVDPSGKTGSLSGGEISVIHHSHNDGYLLLPGEDWSLLSIGGMGNSNKALMAIGPNFNVSEVLKSGSLAFLDLLTSQTQFVGLKNVLQPSGTGLDFNLSLGPTWVYDPIGNKGYFKFFLGGALSF